MLSKFKEDDEIQFLRALVKLMGKTQAKLLTAQSNNDYFDGSNGPARRGLGEAGGLQFVVALLKEVVMDQTLRLVDMRDRVRSELATQRAIIARFENGDEDDVTYTSSLDAAQAEGMIEGIALALEMLDKEDILDSVKWFSE